MTQTATDLRNTIETARRIRFEPTPIIGATNVQDAIQQVYSLVGRLTSVAVVGQLYTYQASDTNKLIRRSNGVNAMIDSLPNPALAVDTLITITNDGTGVLAIGALAGALLDGSNNPIYIGPGQSVSIYSSGGNYYSIGKPLLARMASSTNDFYVDIATGNNSTHSGVATGDAFASLEYAYNFLKNNVFANGKTVRLNVAPSGVYHDNFTMSGPIPGIGKASSFILRGTGAAPSDVLLRPDGGSSGVTLEKGAKGQFQNVEFRSFNQNGISVVDADSFAEIQAVAFGSAPAGAHVYASGGAQIDAVGGYLISGGAAEHLYAVMGGFINMEGAYTYTLTGVPAFTDFALARFGGKIDHKLGTFVGDAIGRRFNIENLSILHTQTSASQLYWSMPSMTNGVTGATAVWD